MTASDLILSPEEIQAVTRYKQPAAQLRELHRQGFWRARRSKADGKVVLERAHYEAICAEGPAKKGGSGRRQAPPPDLLPA